MNKKEEKQLAFILGELKQFLRIPVYSEMYKGTKTVAYPAEEVNNKIKLLGQAMEILDV